jgi:hypothetical protein
VSATPEQKQQFRRALRQRLAPVVNSPDRHVRQMAGEVLLSSLLAMLDEITEDGAFRLHALQDAEDEQL